MSPLSTESFQTWLSESERQFFHFNSCFKKVSGQEFFSACARLTLLSRVLMDSALCGLRNVFPNNCLGMPSCCRDDSRWDYNSLTSCPPPLSFSFFCSPFLNTFHCNQIFFPMFCQHRWSNNGAISLLLLLCKITVYPFILWNGSLDIYILYFDTFIDRYFWSNFPVVRPKLLCRFIEKSNVFVDELMCTVSLHFCHAAIGSGWTCWFQSADKSVFPTTGSEATSQHLGWDIALG